MNNSTGWKIWLLTKWMPFASCCRRRTEVWSRRSCSRRVTLAIQVRSNPFSLSQVWQEELLLSIVLEGVSPQRNHDFQDQGILWGQQDIGGRGPWVGRGWAGVDTDMDAEKQEKDQEDFWHDREDLPMPFRTVWQELRFWCFTQPASKAEA